MPGYGIQVGKHVQSRCPAPASALARLSLQLYRGRRSSWLSWTHAQYTARQLQRTLQGDFALSLFEDGVLPAAFMVGLLGASLVFAQASHTVNGASAGTTLQHLPLCSAQAKPIPEGHLHMV